MVTRRGLTDAIRYIDQLPDQIERKLLRGAGKAAIEVVAEDARLRAKNEKVRSSVHTALKVRDGKIFASIQTKGPGAFLALWLEWGTEPHYITVAPRRVERAKGARVSLKIDNNFPGMTVFHKGSQAFPFVRPAFDNKQREAVQAAQAYINGRVTPKGIIGSDEPEVSE